jgi:hypothetical protein
MVGPETTFKAEAAWAKLGQKFTEMCPARPDFGLFIISSYKKLPTQRATALGAVAVLPYDWP